MLKKHQQKIEGMINRNKKMMYACGGQFSATDWAGVVLRKAATTVRSEKFGLRRKNDETKRWCRETSEQHFESPRINLHILARHYDDTQWLGVNFEPRTLRYSPTELSFSQVCRMWWRRRLRRKISGCTLDRMSTRPWVNLRHSIESFWKITKYNTARITFINILNNVVVSF